MVKKPLVRCKNIIACLNEQGFTNECSKGDIARVICGEYGMDERTTTMYLRAMSLFKFIRYKENGIYEILVNSDGTPLRKRK